MVKNYIVAALILSGIQMFADSAPEPLVVEVDATQVTGKIDPFWASQIIHPTESLLTEEGQSLLQLMTSTGAARQYVRIYNQPENAVKVDASGKITYDWSNFDKMAELILSTGNRLKVVFFGMPTALAAFPEKILKRSNGSRVCISPPKDYAQWQELCAEFTRHVIKIYGTDEVKRWTFRCWNEPDLGGFWYKGDVGEYFKLYDHFAMGVKGVCPEIRIGGPALSSTHTYKNPDNFKRFQEHVTHGVNHATGKSGVPLDFIAIHTYGGSGGGGGPGRKYPDTEYMLEQQLRYAEMRDAYPELKSVPINVEEWGETSGGTKRSDVRNSEFSSAFLVDWVAQHINMKQKNDLKFESFTFCASGYEKTPEHDFMGYRTLHTKNGFHKPILNAYKLLDRIPNELVSVQIDDKSTQRIQQNLVDAQKGTIQTVAEVQDLGKRGLGPRPTESANKGVRVFAARNHDKVCVVLVNFQHDQLQSEGESIPVSLKAQLPWDKDTPVEIKQWSIDKNHSNAYTAYKEVGSPENPTPEQVEIIKERMELELQKPSEKTTCGKLSDMAVELSCNGAILVEFIKIPPPEVWPKFNYPPVIEGAQVETFKKIGDKELKVWMLGVEPEDAPKPAIVFFYGGGWSRGSPEQYVRQGHYLVERGMVAIMAEYRVASRDTAKPAECVADAKSCMRWVRKNAQRLGINPRMIAAAGGSAGGHLAVSTATLPGLDEKGEDCSVSCIPDALILCNAGFMMMPFGELKMKGFGAGRNEKSFGCKPEEISPIHHMRKGLPPTLILHGTADRTIPFATAELFCEEMKKAGNRCKLVAYEGADHGFYLGDKYHESLAEMACFLRSLGYLQGTP